MPERIIDVPTNIVTGFLGAGKSTVIRELMRQKPAHERWAILVNEFGEVGLDASLLSEGQAGDETIFFKEVPGGCMCCVAGIPMQMALNLLLAKAKPHRLLIEPTGLGHPREVLAGLSAEQYRDVLDLRATLTLVDARKVNDERYASHATFNEQIEVADIIVASKADAYDTDEVANLEHYLQSKGWDKPVVSAEHGRLSLDVLDAPAQPPDFDCTKTESEEETGDEVPDLAPAFPPEGILRFQNEGEGFVSYGWIFEPSWIFDLAGLRSLVATTDVQRLKAAMRTPRQFVGWNVVPESCEEVELPKQADSRIEIITRGAFDASGFERALLAIVTRS